MVKNMPARWETQDPSLSWEDPLEKEMASHYWNSYLENSMDRGAWWAICIIYECLVKSNLKSVESTWKKWEEGDNWYWNIQYFTEKRKLTRQFTDSPSMKELFWIYILHKKQFLINNRYLIPWACIIMKVPLVLESLNWWHKFLKDNLINVSTKNLKK